MRDEQRANELEDRLIDFAVRVIRLAVALPRSVVGQHLSSQLLRAATAPAPNYAEARGSESRADFAHKLKIAVKELNEARVWLQMIRRSELVNPKLLVPLLEETDQLCRILNASVTTARQKRTQ
jgi:four helix bundle protein